MAELAAELAYADLVVSCTGAPELLVRRDALAARPSVAPVAR